jgi:hypothetical protein
LAGDTNYPGSARQGTPLIRLPNGNLLNIGLTTCFWDDPWNPCAQSPAAIYEPATNVWHTAGYSINSYGNTAVLMADDRVLVLGGYNHIDYGSKVAEIGVPTPAHAITGTLGLPDGWINTATFPVEILAQSAAGDVQAASINKSTDFMGEVVWRNWITLTQDIPFTTTWTAPHEGADLPVALRLRAASGLEETVVTGTVSVDLTPPAAGIAVQPPYDSTMVPVAWSGSDALSGLAGFQVQVRVDDGGWTDWLPDTLATSSTFTGEPGHRYAFRVRARDGAGHLSEFAASSPVAVAEDAPIIQQALINGGARATTSRSVFITVPANGLNDVTEMSFSSDGASWSAWQPHQALASVTLAAGDGEKTLYVRGRDVAGNISTPISATITLDTSVRPEYGFSINEGALYTNQVTVTLFIGAPKHTAQMIVSNDGGFAKAEWEPFDTRREWQITSYGEFIVPRTVYVRYMDIDGNISATSSDDIILDPNPPSGTITITDSPSLQKPDGGSVTLQLSAKDDLSGVSEMQISLRRDFQGAAWEPFATSRSWNMGGQNVVYARFRDYAGNVSASCQAVDSPYVYLPLVITH